MRGYITIPDTVTCSVCKYCGARPIIALADEGEYVVKCPSNPSHYQTQPGLIDIEDWNLHNVPSPNKQVDIAPSILHDHFFHLNGAIVPLANAD